MQSSSVISDYPIVIEPTVQFLEITKGKDANNMKWTQLKRVPTAAVISRLSGFPPGVVHFFGDGKNLDASNFLLAYTSAGRLKCTMHRSKNDEWSIHQIDIEAVGDRVSQPSVRLVFCSERMRTVFLRYLEQVQSGKVNNPSLAVVLDKLSEPPRLIDVWGPL